MSSAKCTESIWFSLCSSILLLYCIILWIIHFITVFLPCFDALEKTLHDKNSKFIKDYFPYWLSFQLFSPVLVPRGRTTLQNPKMSSLLSYASSYWWWIQKTRTKKALELAQSFFFKQSIKSWVQTCSRWQSKQEMKLVYSQSASFCITPAGIISPTLKIRQESRFLQQRDEAAWNASLQSDQTSHRPVWHLMDTCPSSTGTPVDHTASCAFCPRASCSAHGASHVTEVWKVRRAEREASRIFSKMHIGPCSLLKARSDCTRARSHLRIHVCRETFLLQQMNVKENKLHSAQRRSNIQKTTSNTRF